MAKNTGKYRVQVTMGCGWQNFRNVDSAEDAAVAVHIARRTGYRSQILDRHGERLHVVYDRTGRAQLVTVPL